MDNQNTFCVVCTGRMDDFGNYIVQDMDQIVQACRSLTTFWIWND